MPVDPASAGPHLEDQGRDIWFCSPGCRDRFQQDPERYQGDPGSRPLASEPVVEIDPVCGMEADPKAAAAALVHDGQQFYFCSEVCRDRFLQRPDSFSRMRSLNLPTSQTELPVDPICGMSVDPDDPGAKLEFPDGTMYFCCQPCADEYAAAHSGGR